MKVRKLFAIALIMALVTSIFPVVTANAADTYGTTPYGWSWRIDGGTLYIEGTGEIPDYVTDADIKARPWEGLHFSRIDIGEGITMVGKNAFAYCNLVNWVTVRTNTFFADKSCFTQTNGGIRFRIIGHEQFKEIGNTKYSCFENIASVAPNIDCGFIVDSEQLTYPFRNVASPNLRHVYYATDQDGPWRFLDKELYIGDWKSDVSLVTPGELGSVYVTGGQSPMTLDFHQNIAAFLGTTGYYETTYDVVCADYAGNAKVTSQPVNYVINVKTNIYKHYHLIQFTKDGQVIILDDIDSSPDTVTFTSSYPTARYVLYYTL